MPRNEQTCKRCKWWMPNHDPLSEIEIDIHDESEGEIPTTEPELAHWACLYPLFKNGINDKAYPIARNSCSVAGSDDSENSEEVLSFLTGPDFGCVFWESNVEVA